MRLINTSTKKLESHHINRFNTPPYAILSHMWNSNEVLFSDIQSLSFDELQEHPGFKKIAYAIDQAAQDGYSHVWIDSCCIDKNSSAELSEAINSMFEWYSRAEKQMVYKGWTLQELLAPKIVRFYGYKWKYLGTSDYLVEIITKVTRIAKPFLFPKARPQLRLETASIAQRMSWAANRQTTRVEDEAYSLLGLFSVGMPLLYGEGKRAFIRLQEEIMKVTTDHSIFVWNRTGGMLLADSPRGFYGNWNLICTPATGINQPFSLTNAGLKIRLPVRYDENSGIYQCLLNCEYNDDTLKGTVALRIEPAQKEDTNPNWTWRFHKPFCVSEVMESDWSTATLMLDNNEQIREMTVLHSRYPDYPQIVEAELDDLFTPRYFVETEFKIVEAHPFQCWSGETRSLSRSQPRDSVLGVLILKSKASYFGVVLVEQQADPELPPAVYITGVTQPVELSSLMRLAQAQKATLQTTGRWNDSASRGIICCSERYQYVATWIQRIRIEFVQPELGPKDKPVLKTPPIPSEDPTSPPSLSNHNFSDRLIMALDYGTTHTGFAYATPKFSKFSLADIRIVPRPILIEESSASGIAYHNNEIQWLNRLSHETKPMTNVDLGLERHGGDAREPAGRKYSTRTRNSTIEIITRSLVKLNEYLSRKLEIFMDSERKWRDIYFVIVVPGNWTYEALDCLFRAVHLTFKLQERFPSLQNILAISETEAAAIYAIQKLVEDKNEERLETGGTFVFCDANNDGVDAATYRIKSLDPLELEPFGLMRARALFSVRIEDRFLLWLKKVLGQDFDRLDPEKIVGSKDWTRSKNRMAPAMHQMLRDFDRVKSSFSSKYWGTYRDKIQCPWRTTNIPGVIDSGHLIIPNEVMVAFLDPIIQEILEVIHSQIGQLEDEGSKPERIIFVGSLAEANHIPDEVKSAFGELQQIPVYTPLSAPTGTLCGAVLYGAEKNSLGRALRRLEPVSTIGS